jgi:hypothetical protein
VIVASPIDHVQLREPLSGRLRVDSETSRLATIRSAGWAEWLEATEAHPPISGTAKTISMSCRANLPVIAAERVPKDRKNPSISATRQRP